MVQAEYRAVFWNRFGATVFSGIGAVSLDVEGLFDESVHFTVGAGVRFMLSKQDHINLRLDVAANEEGAFFPYLTVLEAF